MQLFRFKPMAIIRRWSARTSALLSLGALFVFIGGCQKEQAADGKATPALKVEVTALQPQTWQSFVAASGTIVARDEVLIGAEVSGVRVRDVRVDVGQTVRAGEVLLTLDDRQLQMNLLQARAQRKQAQASLTVAEADARRGAVLRQKGLVSARDTDQTAANLLTAQAGLEVANAAVAAAELQVSFATVRAPSAGLISARNVQPGSLMAPGAELFRLIKDQALEWRAELGEQQFAAVQLGDVVEIESAGKTSNGQVRALDAGLRTQSRTGFVYVDLPSDAGLRVGAFAQGRIGHGERRVQIVPSSAVVRRDGFAYVFVVQNNIVSLTRINVGDQRADQFEVLSGLQPQQQVVASGAGFLADGDRVEVIASPAPPALSTKPLVAPGAIDKSEPKL